MGDRSYSIRASLLLFCCCSFFCLPFNGLIVVRAFTGTYGINYGRIADNIPPPESVVSFLKKAKIKDVRIYDTNNSVLTAFRGSGLDLIVNLPNEYLKDVSMNESRAMNWIKENVQPYLPHTRIRGIAIGNEVFAGTSQEFVESLLGAIKNVYSALSKLKLADLIEVSTPHSVAVFVNSYPPSSCTFREDVLEYMKPVLDFFSQTGAPFYVNIYPFLAYKYDPGNIDINFALFNPNPGVDDPNTNLHYDNLFDAQIDAAYAALKAVGHEKMEVRISETGWASSGDEDETGATVQNARTYNYNLRKRLFKKKGSERHFGLLKADGTIAYDIGVASMRPSSASSSLLSLKDIEAQGQLIPFYMVLTTCIIALLPLVS